MKTLIVGRTSTGKDSLKDILINTYGWNFVKSTTNRPKRTEDEDTHVFLSDEEAKAVPNEDKVAKTVINGYEYFASRQQVNDADAYIIDPEGVYMLLRNMPEEWFIIVYMQPASADVQEEMALRRSDDPEKEIKVFHSRKESEDAQFTLFEEKMNNGTKLADNCDTILSFTNTYKYKDLEDLAISLELRRRFHKNIRPMIQDLIDTNIMNHDENGNPILTFSDNTPLAIPIDGLAEYLYENEAMLGNMTKHWLQLAKQEEPDNEG